MSILLPLLYAIAAGTGAGVVFSRDPRRQVLAIAANGLALTLLFTALQAPDVAFSELVVGTAATPLLFVVVLASIRTDEKKESQQDGGGDGGSAESNSPTDARQHT
jgi:energy-converting hydrogenase B subunit D